ncbi:MAG: bifunctional phosphoglucose/phosphomannose isomerase [Candidatus Marinimicrobia bacterium]|jgi:glucose/mannose-6-phosphate isomerase|nr:bifunctional phosphoglucose/phosphomannose isomerase [Candidatus Neomarinimicrobiota bacterium]MBT3500835.1 bifunctional phosphoglucose/phosphomannose isomerase [Candidatus Neomarinimicrobiota bacterium]MBT3838869.1 bifunctional phosphoglucose/phosphomannose isomerase [Candidatus Neomarinimicrobiota bacterium]MBT3998846.1 bifunctional phosphoglucose/phosphomannose isomerase [Candidatus Neomarinimicrobiota bacterium]MBT4282835.1 bifunctional phosphoglucose/phosphomannose isomerase [Candidatus
MTKRFDPENMYGSIWEFPENLTDAIQLGNNISLKHSYNEIQNIVIAGMGGSAIGGDVVSILEKDNLNIPIIVCRGYSLPNWVNENTMVICSSYSGNTEETLSALEDAIQKNAQICGITTGGKIAGRLKALDKDVVIIPSGLQPRAALAFSFIPIAKCLEKAGVLSLSFDQWMENAIEAITQARDLYSQENDTNPVYELAQQIYNRIPIIYADNSTLSVASVRLKGQFCENGKMLAYHNDLPEFNHNEIVGWENNPDIYQNLFVIWLTDIQDNVRVKHRQTITQEILNEVGVDQFVLEMTGESFQERFLHMIHYGDWLSYWCAILHGTDPSPVVKISRLKDALSKKP